MTTLTLDQAKTIVFSASTADEALAHLRDAGCDVVAHGTDCYSVHCGHLDIISFTQLPHSKFMSVAVGVQFFSLEQRKAFLESQQQPTDTVPAVSPVAEARPELCIACDHPRTKVQNGDEAAFYPTICPKCGLDFDRDVFDYSPESDDACQDLMGFFTILGKVAKFDESWQRTFYENLLSNSYIPVASPFDASLRLVLTVISDTHDQLSTRPLEVNCFCPACDYDLATATKDHEADFYHVTCSVCSLDRDFDSVELSTESVDKEAF